MPKRLLRGVIDFGDGKLDEELLNLNYRYLFRSNFEWDNPDEKKIAVFVKEYVEANHETPNEGLIRDFFTRLGDLTVTEKLSDVKAVEIYTRSRFKALLESLLEQQNQAKVRKLLTDVDEIVTKGRIMGVGKEKELVKGVKAGLQYFNQKIYDLIPADTNAQTEGDVTLDAGKAWEEYQNAKLNKDNAYGKFTGIEVIDKVCKGIKRGEMWIHAAAPGELKTTFALNWAYNLVTRYRANVLYVSLEMKYDHLRRLTCALHTANGKFAAEGHRPLDYKKIRDGELAPEEESFYQIALKDFESNQKYCRLKVWAPDHDVSIGDIRVYAELLHKSMEIGMIVIDHGGLVKPSKPHRDYTIELNSVLRESKKLALHFNGGEGIPVLMLFQINRQGKDAVDKQTGTDAEGLYRMSHLAYANEAERSADYITTTYLNQGLRDRGATTMSNLKNRDNELFTKSNVRVDFSCRRMFHWEEQDQVDMGCSELSVEDL